MKRTFNVLALKKQKKTKKNTSEIGFMLISYEVNRLQHHGHSF